MPSFGSVENQRDSTSRGTLSVTCGGSRSRISSISGGNDSFRCSTIGLDDRPIAPQTTDDRAASVQLNKPWKALRDTMLGWSRLRARHAFENEDLIQTVPDNNKTASYDRRMTVRDAAIEVLPSQLRSAHIRRSIGPLRPPTWHALHSSQLHCAGSRRFNSSRSSGSDDAEDDYARAFIRCRLQDGGAVTRASCDTGGAGSRGNRRVP